MKFMQNLMAHSHRILVPSIILNYIFLKIVLDEKKNNISIENILPDYDLKKK